MDHNQYGFYQGNENRNETEDTQNTQNRVEGQQVQERRDAYTGQSAENTGSAYAGRGEGNPGSAYGSRSTENTGSVYASRGANLSGAYGSQNTGNPENGYESRNAQNGREYNPYAGSRPNPYQQNGGYGQYYNPYQQNGTARAAGGTEQAAPKREKKPSGGFGVKMAKCAALALVFGLVAGGTMTGVNYASGRLIGTAEGVAEGNDVNMTGALTKADDEVKATSTSSTYVAADVSDIVSEVMPSIVAITNISETEYRSFWGSGVYENTSCGTGILVSQDNEYLYIATNNHVVDSAKTLTVTFADNTTVGAEVKGTDPSTDLAVVKVARNNVESATMEQIKLATIGDSDKLKVGEASIAIGNALGYGQSVTTGVISALNREVTVQDSSASYTAELIQTDAAINPGNSGGALLNAYGEVIGINSVKYADTDVEGIGYAIPINTASRIIEDLITKEKVDQSRSAYLGISGVDVTNDVAKTYQMPVGVCVARVMENSAAAQYGILQGDIITKFDGKAITTMENLSSTLQYYAAGTTVDVTVMRANNGVYEEKVITVVLGKKN